MTHELLDRVEHRRPNRWLGMGTCQCVCGCGFVALETPPDWGPALCRYCAAGTGLPDVSDEERENARALINGGRDV